MAITYGGAPPAGGGGYDRNNLTATLMNIRYPPPTSPAQAQAQAGTTMVPPPLPPQSPMPPGTMPQLQPAALGRPGPSLGPMGAIGGPLTPGVTLPGFGQQQPPTG